MSLQQAERFVELPHSDTEEGVNFACEVEFFYPGTCENRQVTNYPTFLLPNNTSVYPSSHSFYYCSYILTVEIIVGVFPLCMCCWFRVIRFLFFGMGGGGAVNLHSYHSYAEGLGDCGAGVFTA